MRVVFEPVECEGCGFSNIISGTNTIIAEFEGRPYLRHLLVSCEGVRCKLQIPVWTSETKIRVAAQMRCRRVPFTEPSTAILAEFHALVWEYELGAEQLNLVELMGAEIDFYADTLGQSIVEAPIAVIPTHWTTPGSSVQCRPLRTTRLKVA